MKLIARRFIIAFSFPFDTPVIISTFLVPPQNNNVMTGTPAVAKAMARRQDERLVYFPMSFLNMTLTCIVPSLWHNHILGKRLLFKIQFDIFMPSGLTIYESFNSLHSSCYIRFNKRYGVYSELFSGKKMVWHIAYKDNVAEWYIGCC